MWPLWINGLLGLWLIVLAFFHHTGTWTIGITGLVIAILSAWSITNRPESPAIPYPRNMGANVE